MTDQQKIFKTEKRSNLKISNLIIFFFFISIVVKSQQIDYAVGGGIGLGSLMGDFPSQTTFGGKLFLETNQSFKPFDKLQIHYTYAQKVEKFLPGNRNIDYFSYMSSIGILGIFYQKLNSQVFVEEGIGLILLNDRSFDDINTWNYGILTNLIGGIHLNKNVDLSLGIDYGLTLNNTNASYFLFMVNGKYLH